MGGAELYRELLRLYSAADIRTYENADGTWDDQLILTDIEIIAAHRDEAGAPPPPPLEQVPAVPSLPQVDVPVIPAAPTEPLVLRKGQISAAEAAHKAQAREQKRQESVAQAGADFNHQ